MSYFKKITSVLLVGVMLFGLTACSESGNDNHLEENKVILSKALDKLKEDEEYIISTSVNAPDGDVYYLANESNSEIEKSINNINEANKHL